MKIFVTGAAGFIGYHLIKKLIDRGHQVTGIDDMNDYYSPALKIKRLEKLDSNYFSFSKCNLHNIKTDCQNFDLAINLAAQPGVRIKKEKQYLYENTNIEGFKSFCNYCELSNINRIIYASSSSVYCDKEGGKFSESKTKLEPKSKYGKSKLENEKHALIKKAQKSFLGLRLFSVYGPFGRPDMAYYSFTESIKNKKTIRLNNNGNMYRDMTYIDDIIDGIIGAIDYIFDSMKKSENEIFNLGNDQPVQTLDLLKKIEKKLTLKAKIINVVSKNEALRTHADITKARNLLGYSPKVNFEEGMERFLEWHKDYENI